MVVVMCTHAVVVICASIAMVVEPRMPTTGLHHHPLATRMCSTRALGAALRAASQPQHRATASHSTACMWCAQVQHCVNERLPHASHARTCTCARVPLVPAPGCRSHLRQGAACTCARVPLAPAPGCRSHLRQGAARAFVRCSITSCIREWGARVLRPGHPNPKP
eukprot:365509-Chlamydomonas_euryale.AAC.28